MLTCFIFTVLHDCLVLILYFLVGYIPSSEILTLCFGYFCLMPGAVFNFHVKLNA
jgi:hypothetical protein